MLVKVERDWDERIGACQRLLIDTKGVRGIDSPPYGVPYLVPILLDPRAGLLGEAGHPIGYGQIEQYQAGLHYEINAQVIFARELVIQFFNKIVDHLPRIFRAPMQGEGRKKEV